MSINNILVDVEVDRSTNSIVAFTAVAFDLGQEIVGEKFKITVDENLDPDAEYGRLKAIDAIGFLTYFIKTHVKGTRLWTNRLSKQIIIDLHYKYNVRIPSVYDQAVVGAETFAAARHLINVIAGGHHAHF